MGSGFSLVENPVTIQACSPRVVEFQNVLGFDIRNRERIADEQAAWLHLMLDFDPEFGHGCRGKKRVNDIKFLESCCPEVVHSPSDIGHPACAEPADSPTARCIFNAGEQQSGKCAREGNDRAANPGAEVGKMGFGVER